MLSAHDEDDGMTQRTRRDAEEILRVSEFVRGDILTFRRLSGLCLTEELSMSGI